MSIILTLLIAVAIGYLLGSIPAAVWIGKGIYGIDVRTVGSGNAGSTNVYRTLGFKAGFACQIIDILKASIATKIFIYDPSSSFNFYTLIDINITNETYILPFIPIFAGLASVIGHVYPVFAGFRGGKGINCLLGMMIVLVPSATLICLGVFIVTLLITKYVSLSSMLATLTFPIIQLVLILKFGTSSILNLYFGIGIFLTIFVIYTHRTNIVRIKNKTESEVNLLEKLFRKK